MMRWIVFEDIDAYYHPLLDHLHSEDIDFRLYQSAADRAQVVAQPENIFSYTAAVYYDLFLDQENDVVGTSAGYLDALTALRTDQVGQLQSLQDLISLATRFPKVQFIVATQYFEVPKIRTWLVNHLSLRNLMIIPKPAKSTPPDNLSQWCKNLVGRVAQTASGLDEQRPMGRWLLVSPFLDENAGQRLREILTEKGFAIDGTRITDRIMDMETSSDIIKRARAVDYVWFEVFTPDGSIDQAASHILANAAEACRFTDFFIPIWSSEFKVNDLPVELMCWPRIRFIGFDGLTLKELRSGIGSTFAKLLTEFEASWGDPVFLGYSTVVRNLRETLRRAADAKRVVVVGETGTGKEAAWQYLLRSSERAGKKYEIIHGGGLVDTLRQSQLFGHMKGAFTGADANHIGYLEACNGGTLIVDELHRVPADQRDTLLRVIEDGGFAPVGGTQERHTDLNWILVTNADLEELVKKGEMPRDFLGRLIKSGAVVRTPSLAERREDIQILVEYYLQVEAVRRRLIGVSFSEDAINYMVHEHSWRGNIRELEGVVRCCIMWISNNETISKDLVLKAVTTFKTETGSYKEMETAGGTATIRSDDGVEDAPSGSAASELGEPMSHVTTREKSSLVDFLADAFIGAKLDLMSMMETLDLSALALEAVLKPQEIRSRVAQIVADRTKKSVSSIATTMFSESLRSSAYRWAFPIIVPSDRELRDWLHSKVLSEHPTSSGEPDSRQYGKAVTNLLRKMMEAEKGTAGGNKNSTEDTA